MAISDTIKIISTALGDSLLDVQRKSGERAYLNIAPEAVISANRLMYQDLGARFQIATGIDVREGIEIMYHWALDEASQVITLRTLLSHEAAEVDSISGLLPAAEWIEREIWELLGVHFRGHPDLRHLLLADDWPEGNYPLRHRNETSP